MLNINSKTTLKPLLINIGTPRVQRCFFTSLNQAFNTTDSILNDFNELDDSFKRFLFRTLKESYFNTISTKLCNLYRIMQLFHNT